MPFERGRMGFDGSDCYIGIRHNGGSWVEYRSPLLLLGLFQIGVRQFPERIHDRHHSIDHLPIAHVLRVERRTTGRRALATIIESQYDSEYSVRSLQASVIAVCSTVTTTQRR